MTIAKTLREIGLPHIPELWECCMKASGTAIASGADEAVVTELLKKLIQEHASPEIIPENLKPHFEEFVQALGKINQNRIFYTPREKPAPWKRWGTGELEADAVKQMEAAVSLPVAVGGALMPDAHSGYGLPIGGVLAVKNAVIPYAVGVDIACRMRITVCDYPYEDFEKDRRRFGEALLTETSFGVGATFAPGRRDHSVMDDPLWDMNDLAGSLKAKAASQLGTSGSGNHFVEFGKLTVHEDIEEPTFKIKSRTYLALLSHSGSRGLGQEVASFYSDLARKLHQEIPDELKYLAWLELDSREGQDYWSLMELCGRYAAANHELIHKHVLAHLGIGTLGFVENHHNFAWKETFHGEELVIHRKGATPAGLGKLGIVPGSMGAPGFVVRGKGNHESYDSCSHGAGRLMSRTNAFRKLKLSRMKEILREKDIHLIGGSLDESPEVYKDIEQVIAGQTDLIDVLAKFEPKLVRMSEGNARRGRPYRGKKKKGSAEGQNTDQRPTEANDQNEQEVCL